MQSLKTAQKFLEEELISEPSFEKIKLRYSNPLFSLSFELKTLLFAGIMLLTGGFGIVIYQNIDSIGHIAIILFIAVVSFVCLAYCFRHRLAYSNNKTESPSVFFEFVLLLGTLAFASFNGYLQYQYSIYGSGDGASLLLPAILFFAAAYYFDNIGVLSLAITCLAAFVGITISPVSLLSDNDLSSGPIIFSGLLLGSVLVLTAGSLSRRKIKAHFTFTYFNFASHMLFVCCLSGLFAMDWKIVYFFILSGLTYVCIRHALAEKSFYFLLIASIYGYVGFTYSIFYLLIKIDGIEVGIIYLGLIYLITSSVYIIILLKNLRNKMKSDADIY